MPRQQRAIRHSLRSPSYEHATVAKAEPEDNPKSMVARAMATSNCLEAPTIAARVACSHRLYYLLRQDSMLTILPQPITLCSPPWWVLCHWQLCKKAAPPGPAESARVRARLEENTGISRGDSHN